MWRGCVRMWGTADPNWSNVACDCVRMWGEKTRPKTRPPGDKTRPIGTLLMYSPLLFSPLLFSPLLSSAADSLLYPTLLYSTLLYPPLLYSTLLYSALLYSSLLYSTECPQDRSFSPNKLRLDNGARYCEEWDRLPSQDHRANVIWVIDLKPSTKDDV